MARTIKDFNRLIPEERIAVLGDKEINVTKIPSRVTLQLAEFADDLKEGRLENLSAKEQFERALQPVIAVCRLSDPSVTVDWLLDNTDYAQLREFTAFVLEPVRGSVEGGPGPEKKPE